MAYCIISINTISILLPELKLTLKFIINIKLLNSIIY